MSSDALREAFLSHGQLQGKEFTELPPGTSIVDVSQSLLSQNIISINSVVIISVATIYR